MFKLRSKEREAVGRTTQKSERPQGQKLCEGVFGTELTALCSGLACRNTPSQPVDYHLRDTSVPGLVKPCGFTLGLFGCSVLQEIWRPALLLFIYSGF